MLSGNRTKLFSLLEVGRRAGQVFLTKLDHKKVADISDALFTPNPCSASDLLKLFSPNRNIIVNQCLILSRQICYEPAGILVEEALSWVVSWSYIIDLFLMAFIARISRRLISKVNNTLLC